mgnify:CR=1 FL=1
MAFDEGTDVSFATKGVGDVRLVYGGGNALGACWVDYRNTGASGSEPPNPDIFATAAANLAIGILNGEQLT